MRTLTLYNLGIKITDLKVRVNSIRICKSAFTFLNFFLKMPITLLLAFYKEKNRRTKL